MLYGIDMFITESSIPPDEVAVALEERGFESLWVAEHTHIPTSLASVHRLGSEITPEYWHAYDPLISLAIAATATSRLRLATGIMLLVQRDPIVTAKEIATLDRLSGGRVIVGIGAGWNAEEMAHHGTAFGTRFDLLRERVRAMQELWTREEAEFHGDFVNFSASWSYPKPLQQPHPPVLIGGSSARARAFAAELCDGWAPYGFTDEWPETKAKIADVRRRAEAAGRDPASVRFTMFGTTPPDRALADEMDETGVERVVIEMPALDRNRALQRLDELASLTQ